MGSAVKWLAYISLVIAAFCLGWYGRCDGDKPRTDTITHTVVRTEVKVDTFLLLRPIPYARWFTKDSIRFKDCVHAREVVEYRDSSYRAWVSGVSPSLDSMEVYPRTVYQKEYIYRDIIKREKPKRFSLSLSLGYGVTQYGMSPFAGVSVNYNVFSW